MPLGVDAFGPAHRLFALWTAPLLIPVNGKLIETIGALQLRLPIRVWTGWASQLGGIVLSAVDQQLGTDIGGIDEMFPRGQALVPEPLMDGIGTLGFMDRS